jgi:putative ABC transport system permease protein
VLRDGLTRRVRIADYEAPNPSVTRGLRRMTEFLSLIGLLALLVGGLGVATSMHTYLQQRLDTIAILKCMGARSGQIIAAYLVQGFALGAIGSLAGILLGYGVQSIFPSLLQDLLSLPTRIEPAPTAALQGLIIGLATTLLFLAPPLLAIRRVSPVRIFLREMPETRYSTIGRLRRDPAPLVATLLLIFGVILLASWLAGGWLRGVVFVAGLLGAILILGGFARILLFAIKSIPPLPSLLLRHGLRNLNRPGSHATSVVMALGIGVAFVMTVYFIQSSLLAQLMKSAPADFPNVFLLGITDQDRAPLWDFLKQRPEVRNAGSPIPIIPARLKSIDGRPVEEIEGEDADRRYARVEFMLSWSAELPPDTRVVEGRWWPPQPSSSPLISVGESAARRLKIAVGSVVELTSSGTTVRGTVANIRDMEFSRPGSNNQFIFSPGALDGLPAAYVGGLRVDESRTAELQKALFERFPNVSSVEVGQVLVRVQDLLDKISAVIRFIALFAILAGTIILASSVAATRYQRVREAVLLKTLGATRAKVAGIQATEFLVIGMAAGLVGALLASLAADVLLGRLLETEFTFRWIPLLAAVACTAALTVATGWAASHGILAHRPLEILREN